MQVPPGETSSPAGLATKGELVLKELQRLIGYCAATVVCWISNKLDNSVWTEEE